MEKVKKMELIVGGAFQGQLEYAKKLHPECEGKTGRPVPGRNCVPRKESIIFRNLYAGL